MSFAGHAEAFYGYEGSCLTAAYGQTLSCAANDTEIKATVTKYEGPKTCTEVGFFSVDLIKKRIFVNANSRYDFGVYIGLQGDAINGQKCHVKSLGPENQQSNVNNLDDDPCWDYNNNATSGTKTIENFTVANITIKCEPSSTGNATISACYVYDENFKSLCNETKCADKPDVSCLLP